VGSLSSSTWLPTELTPMSHNVDVLFYIILGVVTFFFVVVEVLLVYFLIHYRRTKKNQVGVNVHGNSKLEVVWTLIPALILVVMGVMSVKYVYAEQTPPANAYVIQVIGHEWRWEFKYPNGVDTFNDLRIPAGQTVLFKITSADVVHGFYIPAVRIQQDALPGRITQFHMTAYQSDIGQVFKVPCDQFCGVGHPNMMANMTIMSESGFNTWLGDTLKTQQASS